MRVVKKMNGASGVAACDSLQNSIAVASTTPASNPVIAPYIRRASSYVISTEPNPSRNAGKRADHSEMPNVRKAIRWIQYSITGFAVRSSPLNVGTTHVPTSIISRVHSAFTPSSTSHSDGVPRFGNVTNAITASNTA